MVSFNANNANNTNKQAPVNPFRLLQRFLTGLLLPGLGVRVRTPTVLQMEAVECGAAALGIVLGYYGRIVPLAELRRECGVSRNGSKASNIVKAARRYELQAKGHKKELSELRKLSPPYIAFWNFNHFLVVEGFCNQQVYLNDPSTGPRSVSLQEFDEGYTGVVLVMEPSDNFTKAGRKTSTINALWKRLRTSADALVYCIIAGFFLTLTGLAIPVFSQVFVDEILVGERQSWLRPLLLAMAIVAILQGCFTLLRLRYLRRLKIKLAVGMSSRFIWHILRLPINFYAQRFAGEVSNRVTLNDEIANALSGKLATTAIDVVMVFFYALVMLQYDWLLTFIAIGLAFVNILTLQLISRQRVDANQRLIQEYGKVSGVSIAGLQAIETLKASGLESDFFSRWSGCYTKAVSSQQELGVVNQTFSVLPSLLSALSSMLFLIVGGLRVMNGNLSIGMLVAFQGLMHSFHAPVNNLVNFGSTLQELEGNLIRVEDVLSNPIEGVGSGEWGMGEGKGGRGGEWERGRGGDAVVVRAKLKGYIELKNITFGYSRLDPPLIENFSLLVKPGQRIALVGSSGSGKSTVAKLLSGLYSAWSGEILFDGTPKNLVPKEILTNSIAMVEQDILLFGGSVRDNLTLWDDTVSDKNLIRACEDAAIDDVIFSMSSGLDAELIEGGANLSGGQRQRVEIARALVNNPSILIMDEATSALDAQTEKIIDENLRRRGCTCVIIAHRLSTIRDCDEIIVLEAGRVVQRGTHQQLWQTEGVYSRLIRTEGEALSNS
ncbi:MAG: NHLP family bacteriocin export ABC transporter peptidase/permease/ATPase subunit [Scytonematopsis contorta HA4267-MV1]|nr:NHLP family bacteriocin export ABC transporter peptidase/permease/ATPase subunit [Scytonematopsis contorta HA4267-MV1]